ncbi:hypothetical protein [Rhodococcus sp. JT-3]|uniref:hypothetical protein n=1 Tax=Rhodococcus sp. JT-3 TaxID=1973213 RepID=UPI0013035A8B|nr:hypothetical protein [Rhodococcus sp. JT-3]
MVAIGEFSGGLNGWDGLLPRLRFIARGTGGDFYPHKIENISAADFLLLLNDVELFDYGSFLGYFDEEGSASFYHEFWGSLDSLFGESIPEYGGIIRDVLKDIKSHVEPFWAERHREEWFEERSADQFLVNYARHQKLNLPEVKKFLQIFIFSSDSEWRAHLSVLDTLSIAIISNPLMRLSSSEIEALCWAFTGAEIMLVDDTDVFDTDWDGAPYPTFVDRIVNSHDGWVDVRRYALEKARQRVLDSASYLTEDEATAAIHGLRINPEQGRLSRDALRKMLGTQPPTEIR